MSANESDRTRLTELIERCQPELGELWKTTAERGGMSEQTLRRLRNPRYYDRDLTPANKKGIEDALHWPRGAVDRVLEDPEHVPDGNKTDRRISSQASVEDIVRYLADLRADRPADFREALHRLDIQWSPPISTEPHSHG